MKKRWIQCLGGAGLSLLMVCGAGCYDAQVKALALTQTVSFAAQITGALITSFLPTPFASSTTTQ